MFGQGLIGGGLGVQSGTSSMWIAIIIAYEFIILPCRDRRRKKLWKDRIKQAEKTRERLDKVIEETIDEATGTTAADRYAKFHAESNYHR